MLIKLTPFVYSQRNIKLHNFQGHRFVDDSMSDPQIRAFVEAFLEEQTGTLHPVPGVDMTVYKSDLLKRFSNPYIKDTVQRLAEDGSNKLLTTMRDSALANGKAGKSVKYFSFVIATWLRYLCGFDENGEVITITDTSPEKVSNMQKQARRIFTVDDDSIPKISLEPLASREILIDFMREIFGNDLPTCESIVSGILEILADICLSGTRSVLERLVSIS